MREKQIEILEEAIKNYHGWEYNPTTGLSIKNPCCPVCGHDHKAIDPHEGRVRAFAYYLAKSLEEATEELK